MRGLEGKGEEVVIRREGRVDVGVRGPGLMEGRACIGRLAVVGSRVMVSWIFWGKVKLRSLSHKRAVLATWTK